MARREISRKFDAIASFAEIDDFLDTPVKRYSSGMQVRLGFAVAAHLEPEILIVDEVLAVGDAAFQKKCLGKMGEVAKAGRTVLFVSHNLHAVQSLCDRVLWLAEGAVVDSGDPARVIRGYQGGENSTQQGERVFEIRPDAKAQMLRVGIRGGSGEAPEAFTLDTALVVEFDFINRTPGAVLSVSFHLFNEDNILVFATGPIRERRWFGQPLPCGRFRSRCRIPSQFLNAGLYRLRFYLVQNVGTPLESVEDALTFRLAESASREFAWYGKWVGVVRPDLEWETDLVEGHGEDFPHKGLGA
jgi:lipopolysaccharide transport system ATP-binding protein